MLPVKLVRSLILGEPISSHHHTQHDDHDNMSQPQQHHSINMHESESTIITSTHKKQQRTTTRRRRIKQSKNTTSSSRCEEREQEDKSATTREIKKTPLLLFMPSKEVVFDTYRLASLARDIGMDLHPTPSLSHIIFTYPSSSSSLPSPSSSSWSTTSLTSSLWSLPNDAVPLPFPSFTTSSSLALLRSFVGISKGLFKLVFVDSEFLVKDGNLQTVGNWDCCSLSLFSRVSCERIDTMDGFSRALAGLGWTLFKTRKSSAGGDVSLSCGKNDDRSVYLFRKVDLDRVRLRTRGSDDANSGSRIRELRLPHLDFRNAPLRILQYILLMTDDAFYLA